MTPRRALLLGGVAAAVTLVFGVLIGLGFWHVWTDHQNLHALVKLVTDANRPKPMPTVAPKPPDVAPEKK